MAEHKSKNTLGRSVPVKTMTDVEDNETSEDGSPRPVCTSYSEWRAYNLIWQWTLAVDIVYFHFLHFFTKIKKMAPCLKSNDGNPC